MARAFFVNADFFGNMKMNRVYAKEETCFNGNFYEE